MNPEIFLSTRSKPGIERSDWSAARSAGCSHETAAICVKVFRGRAARSLFVGRVMLSPDRAWQGCSTRRQRAVSVGDDVKRSGTGTKNRFAYLGRAREATRSGRPQRDLRIDRHHAPRRKEAGE